MESTPSKKFLRGFKKVPQYEDLLKVQLANAHKYLYLPERYVFTASHAAEGATDLEGRLAEHKQRVLSELNDHHQRRAGETPVILTQPGPQGVPGKEGQRGERGEVGPRPNIEPVIKELTARLNAQDAVRQQARDKELQDELSRVRMEAKRHAETSRVLAEASTNLTSIPTAVRAFASRPPAADPTSHLREAAAHLSQQAAVQHQSSMEFLRRNASDLAAYASQVGGGLARALDSFKPPEREPIMVTPSQPPGPPDPDAGRIKKAAKKTIAPPTRPPGDPPPPSMPGSSNDEPRISIFGPPAPPGHVKKKSEMQMIGDIERKLPSKKPKKETLVKLKDKKNPPPGLRPEDGGKNHQEKLTKHGKKPVISKQKDEDPKPNAHHPAVDVPPVQGKKRKDVPPPPRTTMIRKRPMEAGRPAKRTRRVSAHEI